MKRRVGYVSEDQVLPEFLSVGEVIGLHRRLFPNWEESLERRLRERFALSPKARIKTLSKGQARQVALLCAVAHRPEVLLLDEPAGGLDPAVRREFLETSIRLLNETGTTILFSSHYMTDVERMAGRIVMIHDGRLLIDNALDDLREKYSLAMVPATSANRRQQLMGLKECLSVREQGDAIHAIFCCEPERCRALDLALPIPARSLWLTHVLVLILLGLVFLGRIAAADSIPCIDYIILSPLSPAGFHGQGACPVLQDLLGRQSAGYGCPLGRVSSCLEVSALSGKPDHGILALQYPEGKHAAIRRLSDQPRLRAS